MTTTRDFLLAVVPVHQPAPFEKWLAAQPPAPSDADYRGRHRGRPANEPGPEVPSLAHA